jgi:hypothetical protein
MSALAFRNLLEAGDVDGLRAYWAEIAPGMPHAQTRDQAEIVMHRARTEADSIALRHRAYSHAWLRERSLPSGLPDHLKASAERLYPVAAKAVGISVNVRNAFFRPAMIEVRGAMESAVMDADADGRIADAAFVTARMNEARAKSMRALFGRWGIA